ncbi:MAG: hypothetical protein C0483_21405 [Pirellula sp.]|nr:hypothetical protein [Pirellula sp.]
MAPLRAAEPAALDPDVARAAGFRVLQSKHLTLYTDVPSSPAVDELPQVFDAAVPQWAEYFGIDPAKLADWRMRGFLMQSRERFAAAGLAPKELPDFKNGYSGGHDLWLYDQPSDYYRRHLLLHEGTHGFMNTQLGSCGAGWYMEGVAELLGTHLWAEGKLTLGVVPRHKADVPLWGRIALVKAEIAAGRMRGIDDIVNDAVPSFTDNESYAWCWALATFLDGHPRYRASFRALQKSVNDPQFNAAFRRIYAAELAELRREWLVFANDLEYGVDVPRAAITFSSGRPLAPAGAKTTIAADRGWQSSGVRLEAGRKYRIRAVGRYQIALSPVDAAAGTSTQKPWPCEPGGITLRYYRSRPLGMLLGAVEPDAPAAGVSPATLPPAMLQPAMLQPIGLGLDTIIEPSTAGTLYLRVNDSNGELHDNAGALTVEIVPSP